MNAARAAAENADKEASVQPELVQKELLYAELAHAAKVTHDHMSAKKGLLPAEQNAADLERRKQKVYEAKEEDMRAKLSAAFQQAKALRMAAEREAAAGPSMFTAAFTSSLFAACALVFGRRVRACIWEMKMQADMLCGWRCLRIGSYDDETWRGEVGWSGKLC